MASGAATRNAATTGCGRSFVVCGFPAKAFSPGLATPVMPRRGDCGVRYCGIGFSQPRPKYFVLRGGSWNNNPRNMHLQTATGTNRRTVTTISASVLPALAAEVPNGNDQGRCRQR